MMDQKRDSLGDDAYPLKKGDMLSLDETRSLKRAGASRAPDPERGNKRSRRRCKDVSCIGSLGLTMIATMASAGWTLGTSSWWTSTHSRKTARSVLWRDLTEPYTRLAGRHPLGSRPMVDRGPFLLLCRGASPVGRETVPGCQME